LRASMIGNSGSSGALPSQCARVRISAIVDADFGVIADGVSA